MTTKPVPSTKPRGSRGSVMTNVVDTKAVVPKPKRRGIQSIEVGFKILDVLRKAGRPVPLRLIAEKTGFAVANIHHYMISFQEVGVVRQDTDTGFYGLGPYALKLGMAALEQFDVFTAARPVMANLATSVGHTVFLGVWGNRGPTIVYRIEGESSRPIVELRVGSVLPLTCSALGRNFLAHLPRSLTEELLQQELQGTESAQQQTPGLDAPISAAEVEALVTEIKAQGLSRCRNALLPHFTSLSAPVFDHFGEIVAAMTIMGPIGVLDDDMNGTIAKALKVGAEAISDSLG